MTFCKKIGLACVFAVTCGCASYPLNPPLGRVDPGSGYRDTNVTLGPGNSNENFVLVALSGGGTRAAALDYGVLRYLDTVRFGPDQRSLLDEVDAISTSSGASLPAAYYGLFGKDQFLERFDDDVLYFELQSGLAKGILNPLNWPKLWSGTFSRSDLAAEYLDRHIFGGRTFADMRRERPFIALNATDMGIGSQFPFTQGMFDALCSDLDGMLVSRAVTASMAFTPAFSPVTLKNYSNETCGYTTPNWVDAAIEQGVEANALLYARARDTLSYEDLEHRPWIHLLDSGIADNMGIRIATLPFIVRDTPWSQADRLLDGTIRRLIVIIVDAKPKGHFAGDLKQKPPGASTSIKTSASKPLGNYSYETVNMIREGLNKAQGTLNAFGQQREQCDAVAETSCADLGGGKACREQITADCYAQFGVTDAERPPDVELYLLHVSFESIDDQARRERFQGIPTVLQLPRETVDELINVAPELVESIPDFQRLVEDLGDAEP